MADPGSVAYLFNRKGVVIVSKHSGKVSEDSLLEVVLDAGAEEVNDLGESFEVVASPADLVAVRTSQQTAGIDYESAETSFLPTEITASLLGFQPFGNCPTSYFSAGEVSAPRN